MQNKLNEILNKLKRFINGTNNEFMVTKPYCKILTDKKDIIKSTIEHISKTFKSNEENIKKNFVNDFDIEKIKQKLDDLLKKCDQADVGDITQIDILEIYQKLAELKIIFLVNNAINSNRIIPLFIARKFDERGALIAESRNGNMIYFGKSDDGSQKLYHINKKEQKYEAIPLSISDVSIILDCSSPSSTYDFQSLIRKLNNGTFIENGIKIDCSNNLCFSLHSLLETLLDSGINVVIIEYSTRESDKSISQSGINKFINLYNFRRNKDKYKHLILNEEKLSNPNVKGIRIIKNGEDFSRTAQFIHINLSKLDAYRDSIKRYNSILFEETKNKKMYEIFHLITESIIDQNTKIIEKLVYKVFEFYYFLAENIDNDGEHTRLRKELDDIIEQYKDDDKIKQRIVDGVKKAIADKELINEFRQVKLRGLPYIHVNKNERYKDSYDRIKKMIIDNGLLMAVGGIVVRKSHINKLFNRIGGRTKKNDILKAVKLYKMKSGKLYHYFNTNSINYIKNKLGVQDVTLSKIYEFIISDDIRDDIIDDSQLQYFIDSGHELFRKIIFKSCESMANYRNYTISLSDTLINKRGVIDEVNNELFEKYNRDYSSLIKYLTRIDDKIDSKSNIAVITIFNTLNIQQRIKDTQFDTLLELIKRL